MPDFIVLVNPAAGSVNNHETDADPTHDEQVQSILDHLGRLGTVDTVVIGDDQDLRAAGNDAGTSTVYVVMGGDGTLHRVLNVLGDHGRPHLPLPAGTGNDFAKGVGMPADPVTAVQRLATAQPRPFDLLDLDGDVGGMVAMNAAHLGIGVRAAAAASGWKEGLGPLAYPAGAVAAFTEFQPSRVSVALDGVDIMVDEEVSLVGVCNGPTVGGGTALCPPASAEDGVLDLVILRATSKAGLTATAGALLGSTHLDRDDVIHRRGTHVDVTVHGCDQVTWNVDGELTDLPPEMTCVLRPGVWQLIAPDA